MKFGKTSDTSARSKVYEIVDEIEPIFKKLEKKFKNIDLEIFVGFRCLPDSIGRKSFRRFDKKENVLLLDITVSENKYSKLTKKQQREDLGRTFFLFLQESLDKYKFPQLDNNKFLKALRTLCEKSGWLKKELAKD